MAQDIALRTLTLGGHARVMACVTTETMREIQSRHRSFPVATAALGRTISIAAMMGLMLKGQERLTVQIKGDGPLGKVMVDADSEGHVRGYVENPFVELPSNAQGKIDVGGGIGSGTLHVMRDMGLKDVYRGSVEIQTGEIGDDFTYYFVVSEQTPSSVAAGVLVDTDGSVIVSGGLIIQLLPGHSEEDIAELETRLQRLTSISDVLSSGATAEDLLRIFAPEDDILESKEIGFYCTCSRERLETVLKSLDKEEIRSLLEEQGQAEVICHFCNEAYVFDKAFLQNLLGDEKSR